MGSDGSGFKYFQYQQPPETRKPNGKGDGVAENGW
jgi:hypothetical protein